MQLSSKRLTLIACILGSGIVILDGTVVTVALPAIRRELGGGLAGQQWVVESFLLVLSALLLVGGSLGDLLGRRAVFRVGVGAFGVASIVCVSAPTIEVLVVGRILQGVAGALLIPTSLALLMDTFVAGERGSAIGSWTAYTGIAAVVGPLVGGVLIQTASWRWVFGINIPIVLGALWFSRSVRPDMHQQRRGHIDFVGAALVVLGLLGLIFALIEQPDAGWRSIPGWIALAVGVTLLFAFVWWELKTRQPMLPLRLFRIRTFAAGNLSTLMIYGALGAAFLYLVVFLQQVAGYSPIKAGITLLPPTIILFALSRRFGVLADHVGPRFFMAIGPLVAGVGLGLLLTVSARPDYWTEILPAVAIFGFGLALTVAPLTAAILSSVEVEHAGIASGVNTAVARVAGLLAIAAVGAALSGAFSARIDSQASAFSPQGRHVLTEAKSQPLTITTTTTPPANERTRIRAVLTNASVYSFRIGIGISALLAILGGLISLVGIRNTKSP